MRYAIIAFSLLLAFCLVSIQGVWGQGSPTGQQETPRVITTAAPFLLIAPDSRSGAMGEAGVAVAEDANATHWNPSALAFLNRRMGFAMSYSPWLRSLGIPDINLMYLSGYFNTGNSGVLGASLRYFSLGEIDLTSANGTPVGVDKPNEFALDASYALKISPVLSGAVSLRYVYSRLTSVGSVVEGNRLSTVTGDVSFFYKTDFNLRGASDIPVQFTSGMNLSNIGPKVSYTQSTTERDFMPINLRVGYAFKFFLDEYNTFTLTNDFNKLLVPSVTYDSTLDRFTGGGRSDKALLDGIFGSFGDADGGFAGPIGELSEVNIAVGAEYWYRNLFAARAGFFWESPLHGNRKFGSLGAGVKYNVFGLHFSYLIPLQTNHPLANTLRFTLSYDFEAIGNE